MTAVVLVAIALAIAATLTVVTVKARGRLRRSASVASESHSRRLRRGEFLVTVGGAVSLAGVTGFLLGREATSTFREDEEAPPTDLADWDDVRALFELSTDVLPFASFLLAAHPRPVRSAIRTLRSELDANPVQYLHENEGRLESAVRDAAAEYMAVSPDEVALTDSTTMGLALVYGGLRLRPGEEVVTSEHDFYATHEALRMATERAGATLTKVRLYDEPSHASVDQIVTTIGAALSPRTRCLALTWVHSSSGVKLPLAPIAAVVRDANEGRDPEERILLSVDGVHGFGVEDASPASLGCDFFVTGCHKWLFGPRGTGLIWGTPAAWARVRATIPSFDPQTYRAWLEDRSSAALPAGPRMTPGGFHSFEHRWALTGAFELHQAIGRRRIAGRTHALATQLKAGLAEMPRVTPKTPRDEQLSSGLVCFEIAGVPATDVVERLRTEHRILASVTPYRTQYARLGPSIVNTPEEVEQVVDAVAALARTT